MLKISRKNRPLRRTSKSSKVCDTAKLCKRYLLLVTAMMIGLESLEESSAPYFVRLKNIER